MTAPGTYDLCVVGGGLVGLAVARAVADGYPGAKILLLEKEQRVAAHQSGHNSGVVHSGLYYRPGSLKARLCVTGRNQVYETCGEYGIPFRKCGKLVIATDPSELPALDELERRGNANGLSGLRRIGPDEINELEPAATGLAALHVPEAGVADYPALAEHHVSRLEAYGATIVTGAAVTGIDHLPAGVAITAGDRQYVARNPGELCRAAIRSSRGPGRDPPCGQDRPVSWRVLPDVAPDRPTWCAISSTRCPIHAFPFLGVHFTRRIDNTVEVGPNALLALGREHYRGTAPDWPELRSILRYPGFRRLARSPLALGSEGTHRLAVHPPLRPPGTPADSRAASETISSPAEPGSEPRRSMLRAISLTTSSSRPRADGACSQRSFTGRDGQHRHRKIHRRENQTHFGTLNTESNV